MDSYFVPNIGQMNFPYETTSSLSIYDQDKTETNNHCAGTNSISKAKSDNWAPEEPCALDDKIEDSTLQTLLTPEVMNNLYVPPTIYTQASAWAEKGTPDFTAPTSSSDMTLNQLNMDSEFSFLDEILNCDTNDSKLSGLDAMCYDSKNASGNSSTCCTPIPGNNADQVKSLTSDVHKSSLHFQPKTSASQDSAETYIKNLIQTRHNFPPRESYPTQIGIVPPVKQQSHTELSISNLYPEPIKPSSTGTSVLHDLLSKTSKANLKSVKKVQPVSPCEAKMKSDMLPQIVPSSGATKRSFHVANLEAQGFNMIKLEPRSSDIKSEPKSPETVAKYGCTEESKNWCDYGLNNPSGATKPKRKRCDSGGSGHASDDEYDDDDDANSSDKEYDYDSEDGYSDIDADLANMSPQACESLIGVGKKQKQYFWQYNLQAKGPKGTRLKLSVESPSDPHVLNSIEDPVFDEGSTMVAGIRHGGKARKGDGNEVSPNPKKLCLIGHQLMRLNQQINSCQLGTDVPVAKRNEARKEKNKLASRACRLKKKAQHEANKIKLYGLEKEHKQLNMSLSLIRPHIFDKARDLQANKRSSALATTSLTDLLNEYIKTHIKANVAGSTTEYVNSTILKVEAGDNSGGLGIHKKRTKS